MRGLEHPQDAQALLEARAVVADRPGEDRVGEPLDALAEGNGAEVADAATTRNSTANGSP